MLINNQWMRWCVLPGWPDFSGQRGDLPWPGRSDWTLLQPSSSSSWLSVPAKALCQPAGHLTSTARLGTSGSHRSCSQQSRETLERILVSSSVCLMRESIAHHLIKLNTYERKPVKSQNMYWLKIWEEERDPLTPEDIKKGLTCDLGEHKKKYPWCSLLSVSLTSFFSFWLHWDLLHHHETYRRIECGDFFYIYM